MISARIAVQTAAFQEPVVEELFPPPMSNDGIAEPFCCGSSSWWGQAEYLLWWTQGMNLPALATTGNGVDPVPGALGQPGTRILFGNTALNDQARSGGRFTIGKWLDSCESCGLAVTYLALGNETTNFNGSTNDFAILARPFFNTVANAEDRRFIADPGNVTGTLDIIAKTEFQSWEILFRQACLKTYSSRVDWLIGYRFTELEDRVRVDETTLRLSNPLNGFSFELFDQFDTRNRFHGAEFGFVWQWQTAPCWSWEGVAKIALGSSNHRANVFGQTTTTDNLGNVSTNPGGLLALGTNSGSYSWDDFATMFEFGITLRRELSCGLTASFGYSFLYWSSVARAGEQIDTTVNPTQIPPGMLAGVARPAFPFRTTDFWAQGLRFGLEFRF